MIKHRVPCPIKNGGLTYLEVGDLVEWSVLNLYINDYEVLFKRIHNGDLMENIPLSSLSTLDLRTGFVVKIDGEYVIIMDFVGRRETSFHKSDVLNIMQALNKNGSSIST